MPQPRLTGAEVGSRVVVRRLLPDGSATDVVGELLAADADRLVVRPDATGPLDVPRADVVAAKVVPPRTVRPSSSADDVQRVADHGWPGLERERLGGWVLRAAGGFTGRANSALAVGDPGLPLPEAISAVEAWYDQRGLEPAVQVPFPVDGPDDPAAGLDAVLAERGWGADAPTLLMTASLRAGEVPDDVVLSPTPDERWLSLYEYRGAGLPDGAREVLTAAPWQRFATLVRAGEPVAVGRVAVARGWAGVTAMTVVRGRRREGLGAHLLGALLAAGAGQGARSAYLQVVAGNAAAVELYRRAGFTAHHRYHYRRRG